MKRCCQSIKEEILLKGRNKSLFRIGYYQMKLRKNKNNIKQLKNIYKTLRIFYFLFSKTFLCFTLIKIPLQNLFSYSFLFPLIWFGCVLYLSFFGTLSSISDQVTKAIDPSCTLVQKSVSGLSEKKRILFWHVAFSGRLQGSVSCLLWFSLATINLEKLSFIWERDCNYCSVNHMILTSAWDFTIIKICTQNLHCTGANLIITHW